jgi:hypothetical protein
MSKMTPVSLFANIRVTITVLGRTAAMMSSVLTEPVAGSTSTLVTSAQMNKKFTFNFHTNFQSKSAANGRMDEPADPSFSK